MPILLVDHYFDYDYYNVSWLAVDNRHLNVCINCWLSITWYLTYFVQYYSSECNKRTNGCAVSAWKLT